MVRAFPLLAVLVACSPSLSTLQPARTTPAGHVQLTTSAEYTHTGGTLREALRALEASGDAPPALGAMLDAATVALVQPPVPGYQLSASYGIHRYLELGVRTSLNTVRGHVRLQWLRAPPGFYGSLALGVSGHLYGIPLQLVSDDLSVDRYQRWDLDVPLHIGFSSRYAHVWGGPKLVWSRYSAGLTACVYQTAGRCRQDAGVTAQGEAIYVLGQIGLALGYDHVWLAAELTFGHVGTTGELAITQAGQMTALPIALEGLVLNPSLGLIVWL